jgi:hypothetical protein
MIEWHQTTPATQLALLASWSQGLRDPGDEGPGLLLLAQSKELSSAATITKEVGMMQGLLRLVELVAVVRPSMRRRLREV